MLQSEQKQYWYHIKYPIDIVSHINKNQLLDCEVFRDAKSIKLKSEFLLQKD